jgi:putative acetyltransferase
VNTITCIRTNATHGDFIELVRQLDADLAERDGTVHSFYAQYNTVDRINHVIVAYERETPIGCGAFKEYGPGTVEIKRMYTIPTYRGKGVATKILTELEFWAAALQQERCLLETGNRQPEAIALYLKHGYTPIPNYGQYAGIENSVCFEKKLHRIG